MTNKEFKKYTRIFYITIELSLIIMLFFTLKDSILEGDIAYSMLTYIVIGFLWLQVHQDLAEIIKSKIISPVAIHNLRVKDWVKNSINIDTEKKGQISFNIYMNKEVDFKAILVDWYSKTELYTAEHLVKYIRENYKYDAYTEEEFETLVNKDDSLLVQGK